MQTTIYHSLCSSDVNPGSRPPGKNIFLATRSNDFMATRANMNFSTNEAKNKCITSFSRNKTGQSIYEIILFIQGHLQGQKVNFKVK